MGDRGRYCVSSLIWDEVVDAEERKLRDPASDGDLPKKKECRFRKLRTLEAEDRGASGLPSALENGGHWRDESDSSEPGDVDARSRNAMTFPSCPMTRLVTAASPFLESSMIEVSFAAQDKIYIDAPQCYKWKTSYP